MTDWKIPLYKIYTDDEDLNLITKIIKRGRDWALGPEIEEFENAIQNYLGCDYCVTLNSGTSALHACLLSHGISKNDEVIVPSFSFISTANSVLFVGATPKFADIEELTYGLDPVSVSDTISSKTKAILPMDYAGMSCNILELSELAKKNNLVLIEDAAECLGSSVNGEKIGKNSDSAIFSFCGNKVLTTGEGGAVVTNSKEVYEKIKSIRSHGRVDKINYFDDSSIPQYFDLGYNWRMSSITAALGITQLQKLDRIINMRKKNAQVLSKELSKIPEITVPSPPPGHDHIYQMYTIRLSTTAIRDQLHKFLTQKQIFSKVYFFPIHLTAFYKEKFESKNNLSVTERISSHILTLPLYPNMEKDEIDYILNSINEFFENL
jgi:perosamine synthetase